MICPQCKEEMPLLSRICPVCGYVADGNDDNTSASALAEKLEDILHEIRHLPEPTFLLSLKKMSVFIFPSCALVLAVMAIMSEAGLFWVAAFVFAAISLVVIVSRKPDNSSKHFRELKNDFDHTARIARREYGRNREISALIEEISGQINEEEVSRRRVHGRNTVIWIAIFFFLAIAAVASIYAVGRAVGI